MWRSLSTYLLQTSVADCMALLTFCNRVSPRACLQEKTSTCYFNDIIGDDENSCSITSASRKMVTLAVSRKFRVSEFHEKKILLRFSDCMRRVHSPKWAKRIKPQEWPATLCRTSRYKIEMVCYNETVLKSWKYYDQNLTQKRKFSGTAWCHQMPLSAKSWY